MFIFIHPFTKLLNYLIMECKNLLPTYLLLLETNLRS